MSTDLSRRLACAILQHEYRKIMNVLSRNNVHIQSQDGPVLLYAHGFGCNQDMWRYITPAFQEAYRQILFDYVGSGKSDVSAFTEARYGTLHGYAQDIIEICDALGLTQGVTLVAHSVSCSISILAAIQRPELFERLILLGPSPCFLNDPPDYQGGFDRQDLEGLLELMDQNYIGWAHYLAPVATGETEGGTIMVTLSESFCSTAPYVMRIFARATFFADNRADLPRMACPSLILQHQNDALVPLSVGEYVHTHLPQSTLKVLPVTGHFAHMSNPDLVIAAIREYLGG
jgi:sigma-B regulation protein RsbQ